MRFESKVRLAAEKSNPASELLSATPASDEPASEPATDPASEPESEEACCKNNLEASSDKVFELAY